ncbi:MAG: DUF4124 domain-containing protein [Pseudomonadota bacterium]
MKLCCLFMLCIGSIGWAHAEIYKYVDAEGHVTYSSVPAKGATRLGFGPETPITPRAPAARARNNPSPADFPKVDNVTQKSRDNTRRKILVEELDAEEKLLAAARQNLQEAENSPEMVRGSDGKTLRNPSKYLQRVPPLQEEVTLHEKNVSALKTELSRIR